MRGLTGIMGRRRWMGAAATAALIAAGLVGLDRAHSFTVPDWCGGVRPCPPPCLGAPEVAQSPDEFVQLARYELGAPRRPVRPAWGWAAPHRRIYSPAARLETPPAVELAPGNLTMPQLPDP